MYSAAQTGEHKKAFRTRSARTGERVSFQARVRRTYSLHIVHVFTARSYMYYYFIASSLIDFSILSREMTKGISQVANKEGGFFVFD